MATIYELHLGTRKDGTSVPRNYVAQHSCLHCSSTQGAKLQTKHNNGLAYGKGELLQCKQPKKGILLRQVDDALMRWN
jgi:hypothetical protein